MSQDTWNWRIVRTGVNQEQFAKDAGVSYPALKSYLKTKPSEPSKSNYDKIESTLKQMERDDE